MCTLFRLSTAAVLISALTACDEETLFLSDRPGAPRDVAVRYEWVLEGWNGLRPVGQPTVQVSWLPPSDWDEEPFRIYAKRASDSGFFLVATVTSCSEICRYTDLNVASGVEYEYYVATVDEASGEETSSQYRESIYVPPQSRPASPAPDSAVSLDGSAYLRWRAVGNGDALSKYLVYLVRIDGKTHLYKAGETDGTGFLDESAENGHRYGYRIAAVDTLGHVSDLSAEFGAIPRPDARAELVYAHADSAAASGFRFTTSETLKPILAGTAPSAHWRLDVSPAGEWQIVPLNGTSVVEFSGRTTALACGPAEDATCRAATRAPATGYQTAPIAVSPEFTYIFRVTGSDGRLHHGVVRPTMLGSDQNGRDLMIFDWAYQTLPDEPRLNRVP